MPSQRACARHTRAERSSTRQGRIRRRRDTGRSRGHRRSSVAATRPACGFTLIEIALVLAVIGVLLGGVFQGRALLESARVRALASQLEGLEAAWHDFRDRFGAPPGDLAAASDLLHPDAPAGNGNGRVDSDAESRGAWRQLVLAGLVAVELDAGGAGPSGGDTAGCRSGACPDNGYAGFIAFRSGRHGIGAMDDAPELLTGGGIPAAVLARLDRMLDDGQADGGRFRVVREDAGRCVRGGGWRAGDDQARCGAVLRL